MNLVFIHTAEKVKVSSNGEYYTDGAYNDSVWPRYLRLCDSLIFVARKDIKKYDDSILADKFNRVSDKRMSVVLIEDNFDSLKSFLDINKRKRNKIILMNQISKSDKLIIRTPCMEAKTGVRIAKKYKKDYLIECVGSAFGSLWDYSLKGKIMAPFEYLKMRSIIINSKMVLYVSNFYLQKIYPTRGKSVACSNVVLKSIDVINLEQRNSKIQSLCYSSVINIGTLAAIDVPYKGQRHVINAISQLAKKGYNFKYQLVGSGDNASLKALAKKKGVSDNIVFLGSYPHSQIFDWLKDIDIYIQPSDQEGIPRALLEAMSVGCPCIGSNAGGIPELIQKDYIFNKSNVRQLKNAIIQICETERLKKSALFNINKAKDYDNKILSKRRNDFFDEFIGNNI